MLRSLRLVKLRKRYIEMKCAVPNCLKPYYAKGHCQTHYRRWQKGDRGSDLIRPVKSWHGQHSHSLYRTWSNMIRRCENVNDRSYKYYGARGIKVCERWRYSFAYFNEDMGLKPTPEHTLDRIDNDGNYEPDNCRWATRKEQIANRRKARKFNK